MRDTVIFGTIVVNKCACKHTACLMFSLYTIIKSDHIKQSTGKVGLIQSFKL